MDMKQSKRFLLFLVSILLISACNATQQLSPTIRESPTDSPWSKNGIVYEKPVWKIVKGEQDSLDSLEVEVVVKNNNNSPAQFILHFELWSSNSNDGDVLATCGPSNDTGSGSITVNNVISSNGTAIIRCATPIYKKINEADFSSYSFRYGVIVTPFDESRPNEVEVLETGYEKTSNDVGRVRYIVYARIQSTSDQHVVIRFYVLDDQGVQFTGCETDSELETAIAFHASCEVGYSTNQINQLPASLIVDVISWDSWEKPVE